MNMHTIRSILRPFALAALPALLLTSCAGDEVTNPLFGSGCSSGALKDGDNITGAFNAESCVNPLYYWAQNRVPYTSYSVALQEGKAYRFHLQQMPDENLLDQVDAVLVLWGRNESGASQPVAATDDNGAGSDGLDSEIIFIAPRTGTYNLVASSYEIGLFGGYRLTMQECPILAVLDTAGTYANLAFPTTTTCVRNEMNNAGSATKVAVLAVPADMGETVGFNVTAAGFATAAEVGGPEFDVYGYVTDDSDYSGSNSDPAIFTIVNGETEGTYTLLVGASTGTPTGNFTVVVTRTPAPGPPLAAIRAGGTGIRPVGGDPAKKLRQK